MSNELIIRQAKVEHQKLMVDCVERARMALRDVGMAMTQHDIIRMAVAIYASEVKHTHFYISEAKIR